MVRHYHLKPNIHITLFAFEINLLEKYFAYQ